MLAGRAVEFAQPGRLRSDPLNLAGLARRRESAITASITVSSFRPKTVIIGAGVMGLGIAWRLAQAGCSVSVFDRAAAGRAVDPDPTAVRPDDAFRDRETEPSPTMPRLLCSPEPVEQPRQLRGGDAGPGVRDLKQHLA